ncbi:hypothetical protein [Undibacterium sp. Ren11W]|uniref:hypothetical protein n=1 Tax=Undibacterium sp. Ren11W TaxID=3413045 RepID=UPI003BF3C023
MKKLRLIAIALSLGVLSQVHASAPIKLFEKSQVASINLDWNQVMEISSLLNKVVIDEGQYLKIGFANFYQRENEGRSDEPQAWAMAILGAGFAVYQLRRRKRGSATWNLH